MDGVARVLGGRILRRRWRSRTFHLVRVCHFLGVPDPFLVMTMTVVAVMIFVLSISTTFFSAVRFVWILRATNGHLTVDVIAGNHLQLIVDVICNKPGVHFARHIHHRTAKLQLYAIAGRLPAHNLVPVHLLVVIIVWRQLGIVVEENISPNVVVVAVGLIGRSMRSRRPVAMCNYCKKEMNGFAKNVAKECQSRPIFYKPGTKIP